MSFKIYCCLVILINSYCACATHMIYSCHIMQVLTVYEKKNKKKVKERNMKNIIMFIFRELQWKSRIA